MPEICFVFGVIQSCLLFYHIAVDFCQDYKQNKTSEAKAKNMKIHWSLAVTLMEILFVVPLWCVFPCIHHSSEEKTHHKVAWIFTDFMSHWSRIQILQQRQALRKDLQQDSASGWAYGHHLYTSVCGLACPFIFIASFDGINSHIKWIDVLIFKRRFVACGSFGGPLEDPGLGRLIVSPWPLTLLRAYGSHFEA